MKTGAMPANSLNEVQAADFWWSNYLVLDQAGLAQLIDLAGGIDLGQAL